MFNPQAKLLRHGDRVKHWVENGYSNPILAEISPTGYCNASCSWCSFNGKKSKDKIHRETLLHAISDMANLGLKAINWTGGGEPSLHPSFKDFVLTVGEKGIKQGIFTNGQQELPLQRLFSWIRISITDSGIAKVVKPNVPFGICLNQTEDLTKKDLELICCDALEFGASYFQVRPALVASYQDQPYIEPPLFLKSFNAKGFNVYITDYKYDESIKPKSYNECFGYHFVPSIDWNANVSVCLYRTLEEDYVLGNLNKLSFTQIWSNLPKSVEANNACWNCCKNHEINKILFNTRYITQEDFL